MGSLYYKLILNFLNLYINLNYIWILFLLNLKDIYLLMNLNLNFDQRYNNILRVDKMFWIIYKINMIIFMFFFIKIAVFDICINFKDFLANNNFR